MSKSSKQKSKKSKTKQRQAQRQPKLPVEPTDAVAPVDVEQLGAKLLDAAAAAETDGAEPELASDVELETATEEESLLVKKPTAAENMRAALLAKQKQQPKGWKQQVKAGKMVNAHVPKRFNRGG